MQNEKPIRCKVRKNGLSIGTAKAHLRGGTRMYSVFIETNFESQGLIESEYTPKVIHAMLRPEQRLPHCPFGEFTYAYFFGMTTPKFKDAMDQPEFTCIKFKKSKVK